MLAWRSKTSRVHAQIKDFCAILSGLVVAQDYKRGQQLVADKDFDQNADFFQVSGTFGSCVWSVGSCAGLWAAQGGWFGCAGLQAGAAAGGRQGYATRLHTSSE